MNYSLNFTVNGLPATLHAFPIDWKDGVAIRHTKRTEIEEAALGLEARRPLGSEMTLRQKVTLTLTGTALDAWRIAVRAIGDNLVAVPVYADAWEPDLWPFRTYAPQWVCCYKLDGSNIAVYPIGSVPADLSAFDRIAPLLVGRISDKPQGVPFNASMATLSLDVVESSPWEYRIGVRAVSGATWTEPPNWKDAPKEELLSKAELSRIGNERMSPYAKGGSHPKWKQSASFFFRSGDAIRNALSVFCNCGGPVSPIPNFPSIIVPANPTAANPTAYAVRFEEESLDFSFSAPNAATSSIGFVQTLDAPAYQQERAPAPKLFRLSYAFDTGNPELWTDWDAPLTTSDGTFLPAAIRISSIRKAMSLQNCRAEFAMGLVPGSLLQAFDNERIDAPITVTIWETSVATPDASKHVLFSGNLTEVDVKGLEYTATADFMSGLMDRQVPNFYFSRKCNWVLFDAQTCKLNAAAFLTSGSILPGDLSADGFSVTVTASGWGGPTFPDNHFAGGVFDTGTGRERMVRQVVSSTMSGSKLVLRFAKVLWPDVLAKYPGGLAFTVKPGCSGSADDCIKFGNLSNFGAFRFIPDYIETIAPGTKPIGK